MGKEIMTDLFGVFDTEDDSAELMASGRSGFDKSILQIAARTSDGRTFLNAGAVSPFLGWLQAQKARGIKRWFAHNLQYDLGNLFADDLDSLDSLMVGGRLIRVRWAGLEFSDSFNLFPVSVKKLGEALGLAKLAMNVRSKAYVMRDVEIPLRALDRLEALVQEFELKRIPNTLGGLCVGLWRSMGGRNFPDHAEFSRDAILGGRVELFRPVAGSDVMWTDINSLYPSVMLRDFPGPMRRCRDLMAFGLVEATVRVPEQWLAPLPWRAPEDNPPKGVEPGALLFPCGVFRGRWTCHELRSAMGFHGVKILKLHRAMGTDKSVKPYADFVLEFYRRRLAEKSEAYRLIYKLIMNNLYGQLAMKGVIHRTSQSEDIKAEVRRGLREAVAFGHAVLFETALPLPDHVNYSHAAHVTSFGRIRLLEFMRKIPAGDLLYSDTDSIFFRRPSGRAPFRLGDGLGEMKKVGSRGAFAGFGPKLYRWTQGGLSESKAKGVPRKFSDEFLTRGFAEFCAPYKLREAMAFFDRAPGTLADESRGNAKKLSVWRPVSKFLRASYRKKRLVEGVFQPLILKRP